MTQGDVMDVLKKHKREWLSNKQIANRLGVSKNAITANTRILREHEIVAYRYNGNHYKEYLHKWK